MDRLEMIHRNLQNRIDKGMLTLEQANLIMEEAQKKYEDAEAEILQKVANGDKLSESDINKVKERLAELGVNEEEDDDDDDEKDGDKKDDDKDGEKKDDGEEGEIPEEVKEYADSLRLRAYELNELGFLSESEKDSVMNLLRDLSIYE